MNTLWLASMLACRAPSSSGVGTGHTGEAPAVPLALTTEPVRLAGDAVGESHATLAVRDGRIAAGWWREDRSVRGALLSLEGLDAVADLATTFVEDNPNHPQVLATPDGFWMLVSTLGPVVARRYDPDGAQLGDTVPVVLPMPPDRARDIDASRTAAGDVHLVWTQVLQSFRGRVGDPPADPAEPTPIGPVTDGRWVSPPSVRSGPGGSVLVWSEFDDTTYDVWAQRLDDDGTAHDPLWVAEGAMEFRAGRPGVSVHHSGMFVVSWREVQTFGEGGGVFLRAFDGSDTPQTDAPVRVDGGTGNWVVQARHGDDLVVAWNEGTEGDAAVRVQRWALPEVAPVGEPVVVSAEVGAHRPYVVLDEHDGDVRGAVSWEEPAIPGNPDSDDVYLRGFRLP